MTKTPTRRTVIGATGTLTAAALAGCTSDTSTESTDDDSMDDETMDDDTMDDGGMEDGMEPTDPMEASRATVDRFSEDAGTLHVRSGNNDLPEADEAIDFDENFLIQGFGPDGEEIQYYDFDVQPTAAAPIYTFVDENGDSIEDQLNIIGVIPGDGGYNDFWHVNKVTVPEEYEPNTITSESELLNADYEIEETSKIKNCPVVPEGSTAELRGGDSTTEIIDGWYDGDVVGYFEFTEAPIESAEGTVPTSPIYVSFNTNPGQDGGGPPSGFMTEDGNSQTHNVTATVPSDDSYSPLWMVNMYDNADFDSVSDLDSAQDAEILEAAAANVNCPVVSVQ